MENGHDVASLALAGELDVIQEVRACGRALGEVIAGIVNFFNPEVIVVGGEIARAHEQLIAGLREVVYQRCAPNGDPESPPGPLQPGRALPASPARRR